MCENVIGVGCDIIEIDRFERIAREKREGTASRLFSLREFDIAPADPKPQYYAVRFAAKEAVMKALGRGMDYISFKDIEILKDEYGKPIVSLSGSALSLSKELGVKNVLISISHSRTCAVAYAVATGSDLDETSM